MRDDRLAPWLFWLGVGFVVGCLSVLFSGCAPEGEPVCRGSNTAYIIGGVPSQFDRSTVLVYDDQGLFCSGTIVGEHTVLTAAHCAMLDTVDGKKASELVVHPLYSFPNSDLALLFFDEPFDKPPATLGSFPECTSLVAQGYGRDRPRELYERVVVEHFRLGGIIYTGEGTCQGDSGGPLWATDGVTYTQVGVASFGYNTDCTGTAGFVDLEEPVNWDWLQDNIR